MNKETRDLFLTLWDKAVGTHGYDKDQWLKLEELIDDIISLPQPSS